MRLHTSTHINTLISPHTHFTSPCMPLRLQESALEGLDNSVLAAAIWRINSLRRSLAIMALTWAAALHDASSFAPAALKPPPLLPPAPAPVASATAPPAAAAAKPASVSSVTSVQARCVCMPLPLQQDVVWFAACSLA